VRTHTVANTNAAEDCTVPLWDPLRKCSGVGWKAWPLS
jgi:hypothetical protein